MGRAGTSTTCMVLLRHLHHDGSEPRASSQINQTHEPRALEISRLIHLNQRLSGCGSGAILMRNGWPYACEQHGRPHSCRSFGQRCLFISNHCDAGRGGHSR